MCLPTRPTLRRTLALCALTLAALPGCDSGGTGGGGDLRVSLSTSDVMIAVISSGSLSITNHVTVVATVDGADAVTAASIAAPGFSAELDSSVAAGPGRVRAYIRVGGLQNRVLTYGPTTLTVTAGGASASVPFTVHTGNVAALQQNQYPGGAQLTHGREALAFTSAVRVRLADGPAGFSLRQGAAGEAVQTFATATAAVAPNVVHRALLASVDENGWTYSTDRFVVVVRSTVANPATRVRTRSVAGGRHYSIINLTVLNAVAASGALLSRSAPGGHTEAQLTGLRGASPSDGQHTFLLYRDGRLGRATNGAEREVRFLGDLDPADVAADGSLLMRDGSVWVTADAPAFRAVDEAAGRTYLPALPASTEASFVAITSDWALFPATSVLMLAASADGRLWAASAAQRLAPTAQRLPAAPREMVTVGAAFYGARLADGSVWTWRADTQGQEASLTAPTRIDGLVAARLFANEYGLVAVRADGSVASWGRPFGNACPLFAVCERPEWAGLRDMTSSGYVRADGRAFDTNSLQLAFGDAQPALVAPE